MADRESHRHVADLTGGWDYRVIHAPSDSGDGLEIREVYYDGNGRPVAVTAVAASPWGNDVDELRRDLSHMLEALEHPVLALDDIGG